MKKPLGEELCGKSKLIRKFLDEWQDDVTIAIALYSMVYPETFDTPLLLSLVESGYIQGIELDSAFENLLVCWSEMNKNDKELGVWLLVRKLAHNLVRTKNVGGAYVLPKTRDWVMRNESDYQPELFALTVSV